MVIYVNRKNKFLLGVIAILSIAIAVVLSMYLLDTTGKVNQGSFRVNDILTYSYAQIDEVDIYGNKVSEEIAVSDAGAKNFNISQNNNITIYIAKDDKITAKDIYIDNISVNYPKLTENMFLYIDSENKINLKEKDISINIDKKEVDSQYVVKINFDNSNIIKTANLLKDRTEIKFDGSVFSLLNIKVSDIQFKLSFDINILDTNNKKNICTVKLTLPNELLITNGISIIKEDPNNFPFKVK